MDPCIYIYIKDTPREKLRDALNAAFSGQQFRGWDQAGAGAGVGAGVGAGDTRAQRRQLPG